MHGHWSMPVPQALQRHGAQPTTHPERHPPEPVTEPEPDRREPSPHSDDPIRH